MHRKDYFGMRVKTLAKSVTHWISEPCDSARQMGWVTLETNLYYHSFKRITVRCHKKNG